MRIWKATLPLATSIAVTLSLSASAQTGRRFGNPIILTNSAFVSSNPVSAVNPAGLAPNLAGSNATPAIGQPGITPAMPSPGAAAITPQDVSPAIQPPHGFTTGIGQQGFGGAIGQQGTTALGQQGSGTAIGQQGVGTAIIPPDNNANRAIVIGQPEPLNPPPAGGIPSPTGFTGNMPPAPGTAISTNRATGALGTAPSPAVTPGRTAAPAAPGRR
ncbi:MAG TPA: hypothetical protein VFE51_30360 [Verrucomicrobiae bacterium]|nr:hypothetical protein [Verrucomicrobiae bacterium]